jgi:heme/copper-type cytochrome/quinol oxidase subunit 1
VLRRLFPTWTHVACWLGLLAVVVGAALALTAPASASFGWSAYAPIADVTFVPPFHPWQRWVGEGLVLVGAVVAAFALGRLSAQR